MNSVNTLGSTTTKAIRGLGRWGVAGVWITMPFLIGPALADSLDSTSRSIQIVVSCGLWAGWGIAFGASLVARNVSLTVVRVIVPASVLAACWAAWHGPTGADDVAAIAAALTATIVALSSPVGDAFVNGSSYGDERRFALKPATTLLLGPIELVWLLAVAGTTVGPLLIAADHLIAGVAALFFGLPLTVAAVRALHQLGRRWIVFVPAGVVLHDLSATTDAQFVPKRMIASIGPALEGTAATDLSLGALGMLLEVRLTESTPVGVRSGRGRAEDIVEVDAYLCAPTRLGAVLREARRRRLPVS